MDTQSRGHRQRTGKSSGIEGGPYEGPVFSAFNKISRVFLLPDRQGILLRCGKGIHPILAQGVALVLILSNIESLSFQVVLENLAKP